MFDKCSVMIVCADDQQTIKRLELDAETQENICFDFSEADHDLIEGKRREEFDGGYKPEQDEYLCISNFQLPDEIKDAIRNPLGVSPYEKIGDTYPPIKSVFVGNYYEKDESEMFHVAFQRFRKEQYISTNNINLFWTKNTFRREKAFGISISNAIDCYYSNDDLLFSSFFFARQVFDLNGYYRSATNKEVRQFTSCSILDFENSDDFATMANTVIRRKIALINDSGVLKSHSALEIKKLAQNVGIELAVNNDQIFIPNDKEQIKIILGFLDEEAYKGPFSQVTFLANSKRQILKK